MARGSPSSERQSGDAVGPVQDVIHDIPNLDGPQGSFPCGRWTCLAVGADGRRQRRAK
eukprot:CAMPEP_0197895874 /NCGR_PEP_ID=MMETSP1439-20131203/38411_1 /TAXON_ID=66791 /ORGANISM="Gonyaulax spinifera, Strain CCMP409" /LENGTH=57 /DNA_ID=CAMNT_0043516343 /DNA_START=17 /DNA_END=187 /DNA_ORIENTATION=+